MLNRLCQAANLLDAINRRLGHAVAWLGLIMVLVAFVVVVMRYAFDLGWIAMQEATIYLHASMFMLASAYTLQNDGHVRVDVFHRHFTARQRAWVELLGGLLLLLPVTVFIIVTSWGYVQQSWGLLEGSHESGGIPLVYLLKSLIPIMALTLVAQGCSGMIRSLLLLTGHPSSQEPEEVAQGV